MHYLSDNLLFSRKASKNIPIPVLSTHQRSESFVDKRRERRQFRRSPNTTNPRRSSPVVSSLEPRRSALVHREPTCRPRDAYPCSEMITSSGFDSWANCPHMRTSREGPHQGRTVLTPSYEIIDLYAEGDYKEHDVEMDSQDDTTLFPDFDMFQEVELGLQPMDITPVLPPGLFSPRDIEMFVQNADTLANAILVNCTSSCPASPDESFVTDPPTPLGILSLRSTSFLSTYQGSVNTALGSLASPFILQESDSEPIVNAFSGSHEFDRLSYASSQAESVGGTPIEAVIAALDDLSFARERIASAHSALDVNTPTYNNTVLSGLLPTPPVSPLVRMPKRKRVASCLHELSPAAKKQKTRCAPDHLRQRFLETRLQYLSVRM
ncbi:hypothetical protein PHLGIDRAFT_297432 [Phlebiopsis gigantea 11061_1 CR5-6]|uniref:Uncharacterized protein n=1 Tax=Phlebiopsis gigantea (strain 11061_1 CR5-6) TaxID=745531 RepID=A0A0C3S3G5_PHLG1|nr:hypothetical protein PHLGIDRAFT_297432 [Phlebiopsis gigantea 11061_1 CR5-6]